MNRYIFLTPALGNMGGAQMYVANKSHYLERLGWKVDIYYYQDFPILIKSLEKYKLNIISDFSYSFHFIPNWKRKRILNLVKSKVQEDDNVVIESHLLSLAYWGELVAKEVKGRHIINFLEEEVPVFNDKQYDFFEYKLKKWEFMNAHEMNLHRVFKSKYQDDLLEYVNNVDFMCTNVIDENLDNVYDFNETDFCILSIGRLDKPYVVTMVEEFVKFVSEFSEKTFKIIFVGGSNSGVTEKQIVEKFKNFENVNVYILGYTFPVPLSVIKLADVGVASANSILVTADQGIPTIAVDMFDYNALGIYGFTTHNKFLRTTEPVTTISALLRNVLIDEMYPITEPCPNSFSEAMEKELGKEMQFLIRSSVNKIEYFDVDSIFSKKNHFISHLKWYIHNFFGV